jgi:(1->4)-alpha-D-glucan 1-alpha-D-glucosylmutase
MSVRHATYRLQLHRAFGFDDAAAVVDYLARLGVSHVYTSPYLTAAPGSMHGYDVVDHGRVNPELGGAPGHARLLAAIQRHALGHVVDVVPNHMAISSADNGWWWDVLENGPSSHYAEYFDIDWEPPESRLRNTLLLPVLADHFGRVLEAGKITLQRDGARFTVRYGEHVFPANPRALARLLARAAEASGSVRLAFIADVLDTLPFATAIDAASVERRHRDKEIARDLLAHLLAEDASVGPAIDNVVRAINAGPDRLEEILDQQNYRLAWWRAAGRDLPYRRFFDVNTLVGLRVEDERVFRDTHRLVFQWLREGWVDGLRIDHPDGLRDPEGYLARLHTAFPDAYVVVEKILEPGEQLPESWPVAGTTGYEFLNTAGGLFVDTDGEKPLTDFYGEFTGERTDYAAVVRDTKLLVLREVLGSDVNRLSEVLLQICERHRRHRDYSRHDLTEALREVIAAFPVYRTYVRPVAHQVSDADRYHVGVAIERAKTARPDLEPSLLDFLQELLLLETTGQREGDFVLRFQQLSGPAMAKGVEDTAFYAYNRFIALNEVGGDPSVFGTTPEAFHAAMTAAQATHPLAMLATATHDTKRGEDVRARLYLLSEMPEAWISAVRRWSAMNASHRSSDWPDRNAEYFLYQTLVGAWPLSAERVLAYTEKVSREARAHTSWIAPNAAYESALRTFVQAVLADASFTADLERFVRPLIAPGRTVSLAQTLLKLTAPGVPDFYQGTDLWSLTLVDPDNRRPVDYGLRRRLLDRLEGATPEDVMKEADEGLPKLWLISQALRLRADCPAAFGAQSTYEPLAAKGSRAPHAVGFVRGGDVATIVPRLVMTLAGEWADTTIALPSGRWRNCLSGDEHAGGSVALREILDRFPVALLVRAAS